MKIIARIKGESVKEKGLATAAFTAPSLDDPPELPIYDRATVGGGCPLPL